MAKRSATTRKQRAYWGATLVLLGLAALTANLAFVANPIAHVIENAQNGLAGVVPALGLSMLRAAGALALGQVDYFSLASRILLLFSAMVAVIVGMVLLCSHSIATGSRTRNSSTIPQEETE